MLTNCPLCASEHLEVLDRKATVCHGCGLLLNTETVSLDYGAGGGQAPPDAQKMKWRLRNAERRIHIIAPHISGHRLLVDIGCGSGEMLLAAKKHMPHQLGFDTNRPLIEHIRHRHGCAVIEGHFDAALIPEELRRLPKVFALSHVLEHLSQPMALLDQVVDAMREGDLFYIEVPLHTGESFRHLGYQWNLWNYEHLALYSPQTLEYIARRLSLRTMAQGTRVFARASHSSKTHARLFRQRPVAFLRAIPGRPQGVSIPDRMLADYGYILLRR